MITAKIMRIGRAKRTFRGCALVIAASSCQVAPHDAGPTPTATHDAAAVHSGRDAGHHQTPAERLAAALHSEPTIEDLPSHGEIRVGQPSRLNPPSRVIVRVPSPRARVQAGTPVIHDVSAAASIRRVVTSNLNQVRYCYQRSLDQRPESRGGVVMQFLVGTNGRVLTTAVLQSTLTDPTVGPCIGERMRTWIFPRFEATVLVRYPFAFDSEPVPRGRGSPLGTAQPQASGVVASDA